MTDRETTFERIFHEYYTPLCNYAAKYVNSYDIAEEIIQDLFVQLLEKQSLDDVEQIDRFLTRSVKFKCIDYLRKKQGYNIIALEHLREHEMPDDEPGSEEEINALFHYMVAKLPPKTREAFLLIRESGMTYKEAASELGISVKTVENQMNRALKIISALLKEYGYLCLIHLPILKYFFSR